MLILVRRALSPSIGHFAKVSAARRVGNLDAPPDGRFNPDERDLELVDRRQCLRRGHRDIVPVLSATDWNIWLAFF